MEIFAILLILIGIIIIIIKLISKKPKINKNNQKEEVFPYYSKKPITEYEMIMFNVIKEAFPNQLILSQVQLSRFLGVKKGNNYQEWNNRINRMSIDFLICNTDASIIVAIELDDKSHEKEEAKQRDAKKNKALESAEIKLIRYTSIPDATKLKLDVAQYAKIESTSDFSE